jgi:hypothetical protein
MEGLRAALAQVALLMPHDACGTQTRPAQRVHQAFLPHLLPQPLPHNLQLHAAVALGQANVVRAPPLCAVAFVCSSVSTRVFISLLAPTLQVSKEVAELVIHLLHYKLPELLRSYFLRAE